MTPILCCPHIRAPLTLIFPIGHMVPTYKPAASFVFLKAWLRDEDYPAFDSNCARPQSEAVQDRLTDELSTA